MTVRVAICDDSAADASFLREQLATWARERGVQMHAEVYSGAQSFLFHYTDDRDVDILLLDIEMEGTDGVTLAKTLRRDNERVQIVFVTGYSDYIAEGYEVAALHYLMKPVATAKLMQVMDRAVAALKKHERCLTLKTAGDTVRVPLSAIRFAEVQKNYVFIHAQETHTVKMTLSELEDKLDERFYRVGRSALVNLLCICRVTKTDLILTNGEALPLPRGAYEGVNRAIMRLE